MHWQWTKPAALLSHFCVIEPLTCYPRPFHVLLGSWCWNWERRIECKENGLSAQKISKEVRLTTDFRARGEVSKTATMGGISKFIKVPQLASCHSDSLYNKKNASADTVENNSAMHYSSNNSNNPNNSSNNVGPSPAKSVLIFVSLS